MKIIITENKIQKSINRLIQSILNSLLNDEEFFDSYELDILNSIDRVEISHITTGIGITVWLNIYSKINENFDFLTSELQYKMKNYISNIRIFTNEVITDEDYINEMIKLDIKVGDTLMGGKFKNKKVVVKTIDKNEKGDITINGKPLLRFRMLKEGISTEKSVNIFKKWLYNNFDEISFLETSTYDGHPLIKIYYTTDSDAVNYSTWLVGEISDEWNKVTGGGIPVMPIWKFSGYNAKIVIDAEEFDEDEEEPINESVKPKMNNLFDKYIRSVHP